jgi:hypothetical protein
MRIAVAAVALALLAGGCCMDHECMGGEGGGAPEDWSFAPDGGSRSDVPLEVTLGTGRAAFEPVDDGAALDLVRGAQGGTHVWGGVRVKGLSEERFRVAFRLSMPGAAGPDGGVGPLVLRGEPSDLPGWVEIAGLTVFVEKPAEVRGTECDLTVMVTDRDGRKAGATRRVWPR